MKLVKKILVVLGFVICVVSADMPVCAKNNEEIYNTLDEIPEDLDIFKTISEGSITAIEKDGEWYYRFRRNKHQDVLIKVSAFMTQPENKYLVKDNSSLNKSLAEDSNHTYNRICYYTTMSRGDYGNYSRYTTSINRLDLVVSGSDSEFTTRCNMTHCVSFSYDTKIPNAPREVKKYSAEDLEHPDFWVEPSTVLEYEAALKRYSKSEPIIPKISVSVKNTGENDVYLQKYLIAGRGNALVDGRVVIDLLYTTVAVGKDIALKDYIGLVGDVLSFDIGELADVSEEYNDGLELDLSKNKKYVYKTIYNSPIDLSRKNDCIQIITKCNDSIKDAKFHVIFSFSD